MNQQAGSYNFSHAVRPYQIWNQLDTRQRSVLTIIYQFDNDIECLEYYRLKKEGCCRPSDDWRWFPLTGFQQKPEPPLQRALNEVGIGLHQAKAILRTLEERGLVRCHQDPWAVDNRLFVRILFLGQRVVRDGLAAL